MSAHPAMTPQAIEHRYGQSTPYSIGVEEEFQLVHNETFDLVSRAQVMLDHATDDDLAKIKPELMQSVIECATGVCRNTAEARADLTSLRRRIATLAADAACSIASAGTHPFSRYEFQKVTEKERYLDIISRLKWIAQRELIFGLHVHVGIDSPAKAMYVFNSIRNVLPELLALSANSPFWQGRHTGLQSSRSKVFDSFPRSGIPQSFESWEEWERLIQRAMRAGAMEDYTYIWWDVRMHPRFGTIEVRICDAQTHVDHSLALAALVQGTCAMFGEAFDEGREAELHPPLLINENKWSAARYGLEGEFIDLSSDEKVPTRAAVERLVERVGPYAEALGSGAEFAGLADMLARTGAQHQLDVYATSESLMSVGEMLVRETNDVPAT